MQELTFEQVEEISGGAVVNPLTIGFATGAAGNMLSAYQNGASPSGIAMAGVAGGLAGLAGGLATVTTGFVKAAWAFRAVGIQAVAGVAGNN